MKLSPLFLISVTILLISQCKPKNHQAILEESSRSQFERLEYQNNNISVDLGVGLWGWPIPMDYDEDGDYDLLVSCRDVPFNGVWYFENSSGQAFPIFEQPVRLGDAIKDIQVSYINDTPRMLIPGSELKNFKQNLDENPVELFPADTFKILHNKIRFNQWKYVDYENDGDLDIIVGIQDGEDYGWDNAYNSEGIWTNGPLHGYVYLIEIIDGKYRLKDKIMAGGQPIDVYGAPSPNFADFDGDGDLDIICGEFIDKFTWFENIGSRELPKYANGRYLENEYGVITMDLEMIIPVALDWDGDNDIDLVVGDEDGRVAFIENTGEITKNMPVFRSPKYFQQKPQYVKFGALTTPFSTDWDDDGDEDIISGNSAGYIGFIENLDGGDPPSWAPPKYLENNGMPIRIQAGYNGSIQGPCEAKWGYTTLSVADWNNDGLKDIIVNSIWGKVVWYENIGEKGKPMLSAEKPVIVNWEEPAPKPAWNWWEPESNTIATQWRTTPVALDWNNDGLTDLIVLDHEGYLSYFERASINGELVLLPGTRIFESTPGSYNSKNIPADSITGPLRLNTGKYGSSGRRKLAFGDWDNDGDLDLLVNSINASLFTNEGTKNDHIVFKFGGNLTDQKLAGHTTSPTLVDWDKNGIPDLLLGAEDGHFYYLRNND